MDGATYDEDEFFGAAIEALQRRTEGEILHRGVGQWLQGVTTRGNTRRASEQGEHSVSRRGRKPKKPAHTVTEESDGEEDTTQPPAQVAPPAYGRGEEGVLYTMLAGIQKDTIALLNLVHTMNNQMIADRQRVTNLELRVESLQKARMLGLISQTLSSSAIPTSGTTPHASNLYNGPVNKSIFKNTGRL